MNVIKEINTAPKIETESDPLHLVTIFSAYRFSIHSNLQM